MSEINMYRDGYKRIGDISDYMETQISIDHANALRQTIVSEAFDHGLAKVHNLNLSSNETDDAVLSFSAFVGSKTKSAPTVDSLMDKSIFLGAHYRQFPDDRWHLTITRNRMRRADEGMSEARLRTIFKVICWGDQVMEAKRTVKFVKATPLMIAMGAIMTESSLSDAPYYKRVGFTAPIQPDDCEEMSQIIARHGVRVRHEK